MARMISRSFKGLAFVTTVVCVVAFGLVVNRFAQADGTTYSNRDCRVDTALNQCFSPGLCPQKVYYCDSPRTYGMCREDGTGCYEEDISAFDNCGLKNDCNTGMPVEPME